MTIKIQFETEDCTRCGGTGRFSFNPRDGHTCFKCRGSKVQLTRRGTAARKAYDAVMDEMDKTVGALELGDRVQVRGGDGRKRWLTVCNLEASSPMTSTVGSVTTIVDARIVDYKERPGRWIVGVTTKVRVWDAAVHRRAAVRVSRMAGATVTGLED